MLNCHIWRCFLSYTSVYVCVFVCVLFKINMLKEAGTADDDAEDDGSVMREIHAECLDTFYLQYTEENTNQVQVLRDNMRDVLWKAVTEVIKIGFVQGVGRWSVSSDRRGR